MRPVVRAAIQTLDAFGVTDPEAAQAVLSWWSRYDELTPEDLTEIIALYAPPCIVCGKDCHDGTEDHGIIRSDSLGND